jgi:hypothetical protein
MSLVNGYYSVNGEIFQNKISALIRCSELDVIPKWHYFDEVFDAVNKSALGQIPLTEWYKQRALQLREKYDYLILNYSGGSDSHNILHTFLKNNIKLDCIYVQWHLKLTDKGLYTVNAVDKSNANFHSEWDLVLKKDLEWLATNHPDIKIELKDWTDTLHNKFYHDSLFETNSNVMVNISRSLKLHTFSDTEKQMADKGLKVASIFGAEKPSLVLKDNNCFFNFNDKGLNAIPNPDNPYGLEYFYTSPDMPQLTVEQSWHLMNYYRNNPDKQYLITTKSQRTEPDYKQWPIHKHFAEFEIMASIVKLVCYPYWDFSRFQASKPTPNSLGLPLPAGFKQWDSIMLGIDEFNKMSDVWQYHWKSYADKINNIWLRQGQEHVALKTKWHYLGDFIK